MEKRSVLVVVEWIIDLLVPENTAFGGRYINQLYPICIAHQIIRQYRCSLKTGIGPSLPVGIGYIETCNGSGMDLIGCFRHRSLHRLFIIFR